MGHVRVAFRIAALSLLTSVSIPAMAQAGSVPTSAPFAPEKVLEFEAGLKGKFFDRVLSLNIAAFRSHREAIQFSDTLFGTTVGGNRLLTFIINAGTGNTTGIEAEAKIKLGGGFSAEGSASYFKESRSDAVRFDSATNAYITEPIVGNEPFTFSGSLIYDGKVGSAYLAARLDYIRTPKFLFSQYLSIVTAPNAVNPSGGTPFSYTPSANLFNGRIGLTFKNGFSVAAYGKNIFAEKYFRYRYAVSNTLYPSFFGDPRTYGIELGFKF